LGEQGEVEEVNRAGFAEVGVKTGSENRPIFHHAPVDGGIKAGY
jgi:hypothetical protein